MDAYHQQLLDPATYPEDSGPVSFKETHISRIYLTDSHVYKIKKPLDLGFLDFTTLEKRRHYCNEEVRLNRRFAPDTYLGVIELHLDHGRLNIDGAGELVEVAVRMRRLPEALMLNRIVAADPENLPQEIDRLAVGLHLLLEKAERVRADAGNRNAAVVAANWRENLHQTRAAVGTTLSAEAHRLHREFGDRQLAQLWPLLLAREERGFVRDGHGDLHCGNICMTRPLRVYDCIEFNRRFRIADIAADLAFLLMDLDFSGRPDLAKRCLRGYLDASQDPDLETLLPFYKAYRAWVRGKVEHILAGETEVAQGDRDEALRLSRSYFNLALGYGLAPTLFMTAGLMGSGKSTLARALARATRGELLSSDQLRKELAGWPPQRRNRDDFNRGLYAPAVTDRTYREMAEQAGRLLRAPCSVIVDASFARKEQRALFVRTARQAGCNICLVKLECPHEVLHERLERRWRAGGDISDGRGELLARQSASFDEINATQGALAIDSTRPVDYNLQMILSHALTVQGEFT